MHRLDTAIPPELREDLGTAHANAHAVAGGNQVFHDLPAEKPRSSEHRYEAGRHVPIGFTFHRYGLGRRHISTTVANPP